jgi:hypothetical protein
MSRQSFSHQSSVAGIGVGRSLRVTNRNALEKLTTDD